MYLVTELGLRPPTKTEHLSTPSMSGSLADVAHSTTHFFILLLRPYNKIWAMIHRQSLSDFHTLKASIASSRNTNFTNPHPLLLFVWWFLIIVTFSTGPYSSVIFLNSYAWWTTRSRSDPMNYVPGWPLSCSAWPRIMFCSPLLVQHEAFYHRQHVRWELAVHCQRPQYSRSDRKKWVLEMNN